MWMELRGIDKKRKESKKGARRGAEYGGSDVQMRSSAVKALGFSLGVWWPNARSSGFARLAKRFAFSGRLSSFAALPNEGATNRLRWAEYLLYQIALARMPSLYVLSRHCDFELAIRFPHVSTTIAHVTEICMFLHDIAISSLAIRLSHVPTIIAHVAEIFKLVSHLVDRSIGLLASRICSHFISGRARNELFRWEMRKAETVFVARASLA